MISTSAELARARQHEIEVSTSKAHRRHELYTYRRGGGALRVLRLPRIRRLA